jgi:copper transport protein
MQASPLIEWPEPILQLLEFVGAFLAIGPIGFRYAVLRGGPLGPNDPGERAVYAHALRRAAGIGLVGALLGLVDLGLAVPELAARRHLSVGATLAGNPLLTAAIVLAVLAALGFALAMGRSAAGWPLAAAGVIGGMLRNVATGDWTQLVNPLHVLAGGLWIGTLFVLVAAGLTAVLRDETSAERRGVLAARMVNAFSPLALVSGAVLVLFGVITAWRHLKYLSALWTTPYGYALLVKLCLVAVVFTLGAWNWRRQRPQLGSESAAIALRRSARTELVAAGLVLIVTAVLVSLPTPKL